MSQDREHPEVAHLRWVLDHVIRTLGQLTHQVGQVAGRQTAFENEMVNRVKELEGRERQREAPAPQPPARPVLAVLQALKALLDALRAVPWRDIVLLLALAFAALTGQWGALRKGLGLD